MPAQDRRPAIDRVRWCDLAVSRRGAPARIPNSPSSMSSTFRSRSTRRSRRWNGRRSQSEPNADRVALTVTFPGGLGEVTDQGAIVSASVGFTTQVFNETTDSWGSDQSFAFTENEIAFRYFERTIDVSGSDVRRIRIQRTSPAAQTASGSAIKAVLAATDSIVASPPVTAQGRALFALKIQASEQLSGIVESFNGVFQRLLPTWDGMEWTDPVATSNPAWAFASALRGPGNLAPSPMPT